MEKTKPVIVRDAPLLHKKKVKRLRQRRVFTLSEQTVAVLESMIEDDEAKNLSRAIDRLAQFYSANEKAIHVQLTQAQRGALTRFFMAKGVLLADGLAKVAASLLKA